MCNEDLTLTVELCRSVQDRNVSYLN